MRKLRCTVCNYIYDEQKEGREFSELPADWRCPVCNAAKSAFVLLSEEARKRPEGERTVSDVLIAQMAEWGIKYVFGIPGTSSLGLVDAIRKNAKLREQEKREEGQRERKTERERNTEPDRDIEPCLSISTVTARRLLFITWLTD